MKPVKPNNWNVSLFPKKEEIDTNVDKKWVDLVSHWCRKGLGKINPVPKDGIETDDALWNICSYLGSPEIEYIHKILGCAYLMSLWFNEFGYESDDMR